MTKGPWMLLVALLCVQAAIVANEPPQVLHGDEIYYVAKAKALWEQRAFEKPLPSDWRPQGYPVILAAISGGELHVDRLRARATAVQFAMMAFAVITAFRLIRRRRWLAALVLGIAPWPFAFVELLGPDSLTASISFFGLLLLTRARAFFFGALLLSSTLLLRPEMAAVAPVPIAVALWSLRRPKFFVAAAIAFLLPVLTQYAYRTWSTGHAGTSLFGSLTIYNAGAFAWANSWIGTEHEAYDFVYALSRHRVMPLPERAFHDDAERTAIKQLQERARAEGYSADIDAQFAEIARRKKAEHPFSAVVLPRLWHAAHLWLNVETSDALLVALSNVPRIIRRPMLAALLLLKLALLILFLRNLATSHLATLFASFVIARTLLIGLVLNWMVHRYTLAAWLPLIVVALLGRGRAADESRVESSASDSRP